MIDKKPKQNIKTPKVAIIIVNWNKKDCLTSLLTSLQNIDYKNHSIVLVDNASTDGSVEYVRKNFPHIIVLANKINLGGSGGFNTGLRYVMRKKHEFKYAWLLDNDANVKPNTLSELVKVMEQENSIALCGSRIIDKDRSVTIEVGAYLKRNNIGFIPCFRNKKEIPTEKTAIEVDYVAICSALVRVETLSDDTLLDERMFLYWDDADWGLTFKRRGYKVVAVPSSHAYHPSFTERNRGFVTIFYYGVRNSLLTYSKHFPSFQRYRIFYNYFRGLFKALFLHSLIGNKQCGWLSYLGIKDFCANKWGKFSYSGNENLQTSRKKEPLPKNLRNILLVAAGTESEILELKKWLKTNLPNSTIWLFVEKDRKDIFTTEFTHIIEIDKRHLGNFYMIKKFAEIFLKKFDAVITPDPKETTNIYMLPFLFTGKYVYKYSKECNTIVKIDCDIYRIYKPFGAFVMGEITSLFVTPIVFLKSRRYNKKGSNATSKKTFTPNILQQ